VERTLEAKVDYERFEISRGGKVSVVRPFPISIDFQEHEAMAAGDAVARQRERWQEQLRLDKVRAGIGIDRIDYTKGIPSACGPSIISWKRTGVPRALVFVQIGVPAARTSDITSARR